MVPEASVGVGSWQNKTQIQQLKSAMQGFDSASFMNFGSCQTKNHNTADLQSESVYTDFPLGSGFFMFFFHTIVGNMLYYDDLTDFDSVRLQVGSCKTSQKNAPTIHCCGVFCMR